MAETKKTAATAKKATATKAAPKATATKAVKKEAPAKRQLLQKHQLRLQN